MISDMSVCCHRVFVPIPAAITGDFVWATPFDGFSSFELFTCTRCGYVFAVESDYKLYEPLRFADDLRQFQCPKCSNDIQNNYLPYPRFYLRSDGQIEDAGLIREELDESTKQFPVFSTFHF